MRRCQVCGEAFKPRWRKSGAPEQKYCSIECRGLGRRSTGETQCPTCGKEFHRRRREQIYCSKACAPLPQQAGGGSKPGARVHLKCKRCAKAFSVIPSASRRAYCSRPCWYAESRSVHEERVCLECGSQFTPSQDSVLCSIQCAASRARRGAAKPWKVGNRTVLGLSCERCGDFLPAGAFDKSGGGYINRRCRECVRETRSAEQWRRKLRTGKEAKARAQGTTEPAPHWGEPWTGPELEIVLREDLTLRAAAEMIGRTYYAVQMARHKARADPKWIQFVGLGEQA